VPRYAAFLRAVNLGGHRRVTSEDLKSAFEAAGFDDVSCFRASGNVIFGAADGEGERITERIESGLADALGFEIPVFLRSEREVRAIAGYEPFEPEVVEASKGKLQVSLLAAKPPAAARRRALALSTDEDRLAIAGRELYWLPSGGTQRSALDQNVIAGLLGPATMRTKGTIEQIAAKFFKDPA
jgi:uncharacterized protein (DUF1697 family)